MRLTKGFSCCNGRSVWKKRRCIGVMTVEDIEGRDKTTGDMVFRKAVEGGEETGENVQPRQRLPPPQYLTRHFLEPPRIKS